MTTAPAIEVEEPQTERDRLLKYKKDKLIGIAEDMSIAIEGGATKAVIVDAIMAKTDATRAMTAPTTDGDTVTNEVQETVESPALDPVVEPMPESSDAVYLTDYKHLMFTVGLSYAPERGLIDGETADREIERWFERGYDIVKFMTAGHDPRGHRLIWILEKVEKPKYSEAKILMRTLTGTPDPARGTISGFQADAYVSTLVREEGWNLIGVNYNGDDIGGGANTGGVYIVWMLAR